MATYTTTIYDDGKQRTVAWLSSNKYVKYDDLDIYSKQDLDKLVALNGGTLPLADYNLVYTFKPKANQSWFDIYGGFVVEYNDIIPASTIQVKTDVASGDVTDLVVNGESLGIVRTVTDDVTGVVEILDQIKLSPLSTSIAASFEDSIKGFSTAYDFAFGTRPKKLGPQQIDSISELQRYFDYWAYNLANDKSTINQEVQRYVNFSAGNHVFTADSLDLVASLPNGTPAGITATTASSAVAASNQVPVADASAFAVGQVISLGSKQLANTAMERSCCIRGSVAEGNSITLAVTFSTALSLSPVTVSYTCGASETVETAATAFVAAINSNSSLSALGIYAHKDPAATGAYSIIVPPLAVGVDAYGSASTGSFNYVAMTWSATGATHEKRLDIFLTRVVAKSGNTLTLNHKVSLASGDVVTAIPAQCFLRTDVYSTGAPTFKVPDVSGLVVGQGLVFGYQDSNIRYIMAIDSGTKTVTVSGTVYVLDGTPVTALPVWMAKPSAGSTSTSISFATASFPSRVRAGQQVSIYGTNSNSNIKVVSVTPSGGTTTVTIDTALTVTTNSVIMFHEPVQSAQIWSKFGVCPNLDGYGAIALELECTLPDISKFAAWPAFWIYADPTNIESGPVTGSPEIDMLEQFNYFANNTANNYRPSAASPVIYGHGGLTAPPLPGQLYGRRKIQVIYDASDVSYYLDGVLMFKKSFSIRQNQRAQIGVNLAIGSTSTAFNSSGFFPIDPTIFPLAMSVHRMRVFGRKI